MGILCKDSRMKLNIRALAVVGLSLLSFGQTASAEANEGRDLVMSSIEAHGGKDTWYGNGQLPVSYTHLTLPTICSV